MRSEPQPSTSAEALLRAAGPPSGTALLDVAASRRSARRKVIRVVLVPFAVPVLPWLFFSLESGRPFTTFLFFFGAPWRAWLGSVPGHVDIRTTSGLIALSAAVTVFMAIFRPEHRLIRLLATFGILAYALQSCLIIGADV